MPKLNKRIIDALKPEDRHIDYFDEAFAGFGLRVRKSGRKVYFVRQRFKGSQRRVTIGYHGAWTAETTRTDDCFGRCVSRGYVRRGRSCGTQRADGCIDH